MLTGIIRSVVGVGSSIITMMLEMEDGTIVPVFGEGRLTCWALEQAFDFVWDAVGHRINVEVDDLGMMTHFTTEDV